MCCCPVFLDPAAAAIGCEITPRLSWMSGNHWVGYGIFGNSWLSYPGISQKQADGNTS